RYGPRPRPAAPPRLTRRSPPAPLTPTSPEGYGELLAGRQGQGERVVRGGDAPLQEAGREGRHPDGAASPRGLRQAERAQEEEGGGCAQAGPEEAPQDGALTSARPAPGSRRAEAAWDGFPRRRSKRSATGSTSSTSWAATSRCGRQAAASRACAPSTPRRPRPSTSIRSSASSTASAATP